MRFLIALTFLLITFTMIIDTKSSMIRIDSKIPANNKRDINRRGVGQFPVRHDKAIYGTGVCWGSNASAVLDIVNVSNYPPTNVACHTPAQLNSVGICRPGIAQCSYGKYICTGAVAPNPLGEICGNGLDDNCDGTVDETPCVAQS